MARFGVDILVWRIATSHSGSLVNELAGLHVAGTFQSRGSTALTLWTGFVPLHGISSVAQSGYEALFRPLDASSCIVRKLYSKELLAFCENASRICAPLVLNCLTVGMMRVPVGTSCLWK